MIRTGGYKTRSIKMLSSFMSECSDGMDFAQLDNAILSIPEQFDLRDTIEGLLIEIIESTRDKGETPQLAGAMCTSLIAGASTVLLLAQASR